ncbi:MAG: dTMP kinase, partial [Desulfamplus sp.]|nr:dTMP kinase [Desulfamplus sp.]
VILPSLKSGKTVLCDRFADATVAYQGFGRGLDINLIDRIYKMVANVEGTNLKPDMTILFDLDPVIGLERTFKALKQGERLENESRFEQERLDFHKRVRKGYLEIAKKEKDRFFIVDASLSKEEILKRIILQIQFKTKLKYYVISIK